MALQRSFFDRDTTTVARELLGQVVRYLTPDGILSGKIVETEAYVAQDQANHAFGGMTARNKVMFGEPGHAYIYFIYGKYYCFNVVTLPGEAVLIRALEPIEGIPLMEKRRGTNKPLALCSGPAKLVIAMGITPELNGIDLTSGDLVIEDAPKIAAEELAITNRVGIVKATEKQLRFYINNNPYVSRR